MSEKNRSLRSWGLEATEFLRRNVLGLIAIFIALSGTAYANMKVEAGDIERNAVRAQHVAKKQVRAKHLARNSVRPAHLAKRAVRTRHLSPGVIKDWAIADGSVTVDKLALGTESLRGPAGPTGPQGPVGAQGPPGDPAAVDGLPLGGDLTGTFPDPEIAPGVVGSSKIAPQAVGTSAITNGAVTPIKIQDGAVETAKIENYAVTSEKLGSNSVQGRHFFGKGTVNMVGDTIAPGSCTGIHLFPNPSGPAVGMASLAPGTSPGLVSTVSYFNNELQLGVRVCNLTAGTLPVPDHFNYVVLGL